MERCRQDKFDLFVLGHSIPTPDQQPEQGSDSGLTARKMYAFTRPAVLKPEIVSNASASCEGR
jgi:hypothetical protein